MEFSCVARNGVEPGEVVLGRRLLALVVSVAIEVAEAVGVAHVAAVERLQRIALEARFVAVLEQLEQALVSALLRHLGRLRRGQGGGHTQARR